MRSIALVAWAMISPLCSAETVTSSVLSLGILRPLGVFHHGGRQLLHGGRGCLDSGGLTLGAFAQIIGAGQNFAGRCLERARRALQLGNDIGQLCGNGIGIVLESAERPPS